MARIVVLDDLSDEGMELLKSSSGIEFEVITGLKGDALRDTLKRFDGAICRSGVKISADSLEQNQRLRAIVRAGVGTDNIDKAAATQQGIVVMNTPSGNTVSTAEHTMALILGLARNTAQAHQSLRDGKWDRKNFSGFELRGKTLGIIGLGRIGQSVAQKARGFEMKVIGYDPFLSREKAEELQIELFSNVDELLRQVDILTVHTPMTVETENLINAERLAHMKEGVRLINCARGGIYNEGDLLMGLKSGKIGGVALDVFTQEPCTDSPLFQLPNVLCTPHLGASTDEAQRRVAVEAVALLLDFFATGEIKQAVNMVTIDAAARNRLRAPANLAYRLGRFMQGWHGGALDECQLTFEGDFAGEDHRLLSAIFCVGILEGVVGQINLVNAESQCRERGIKLTKTTVDARREFNALITATVSGDGKTLQASGTLFGSQPRMVMLNQFPLETPLEDHLLIFTHQDVPGIIGFVGGILARHQVNIAQMVVGRIDRTPGGDAIGILTLDGPAPERTLNEILEHPKISTVRAITLPVHGLVPDFI